MPSKGYCAVALAAAERNRAAPTPMRAPRAIIVLTVLIIISVYIRELSLAVN
jgi:hypothetical protein